ncbi:hypothetical protein [Xylanivirga thermophila]|uniref:hypothetical protein n=1 Tax=Xylanivirga thermophila TaxID=2496273 RepID=UPI00101D9585|nr:hypothetical protein [Xylanivirga thermophila]
MNNQSIFEILSENISNTNTYNDNFNLDDILKTRNEDNIRWAPGALDGVYYYHTNIKVINNDRLTPYIIEIQNTFAKNENLENNLLVELANFIQENTLFSIIDPLHDILMNNDKGFTIGAFLSFAFEQLIKSSSVEIIKFALGIFELLDIRAVERFIPNIRDIIKVFAYYDEFSLNCIWWMKSWPDANDEIFKVAQKTDGWGRIHALREIDKLSDEQQVWILNNAISNSVFPAYTALDIYHKCNVLTRLKGDIDSDTLDSIVFLIVSLLDEGPVQGISALKEDEFNTLFKLLFKQIDIHKDMFTDYPDIVDLFLYFND